jgi:hypothetical protein
MGGDDGVGGRGLTSWRARGPLVVRRARLGVAGGGAVARQQDPLDETPGAVPIARHLDGCSEEGV